MTRFSKFLNQKHWTKIIVLLSLLLLLWIGAVPGYRTGHWQWKQPFPVKSLKELKQLRTAGLNLPGWQTTEKTIQDIGEHKWSVQVMNKENSSTQAMLLLLPQNGPKDQPQVEWTDVNSWGRLRWGKWEIAQYREVEFTVKQPTKLQLNPPIKIKARFFRAYTKQNTFAVLQWYAIPTGGHPSLFNWFVADQLAQLHQKRIPWVAVSILMLMEPLGDVEKYWSELESLGETVQAMLIKVGSL